MVAAALLVGLVLAFPNLCSGQSMATGVTFFPWRNEVVRWNFEYIHLNRSPVGSITLPYSVGGNGSVFHSAFMVYF